MKWNDPLGNLLVSINRDGTVFADGITFPASVGIGGTGSNVTLNGSFVQAVPVVQVSEDHVGSVLPTYLTMTEASLTLYLVTFYYGPSGTTGSGTWTPTLSWTDPTGNDLSTYFAPATAGNVTNFEQFSIPCFCKANTQITVVGDYSGTPFPMNIALRIVAMP
jgi:hypothetical protein